MGNLITTNQIPVIWDTIKTTLNSENINAIAALMGITGTSLRDFGNIKYIKKLFKKCEEEFPDGLETEEQETTFYDSFIELSDFLKENKNIDGKVFEKINDLLVNGIKKEDLLIKEYVKILENLSWLDLSVLINLETVYTTNKKFLTSSFYDGNRVKERNINSILEILKERTSYPQELINIAIQKLQTNNLVSNEIIDVDNYYRDDFKITTELGDRIKKLLEND